MPPNTVKVARPGKWGNPHIVGQHGDAKTCVSKFRAGLFQYRNNGGSLVEFCADVIVLTDIVKSLRGKNLACWCKLGEPCHADVLLELANDSGPNDLKISDTQGTAHDVLRDAEEKL